MEFVRFNPVTRSWKSTLVRLLIALALLGPCLYLLYELPDVTGILAALVFFVVSVAIFWAAIANSYTGDCPACGSRQNHLGGLHRCNHCLAYGEVVKGEYRELEADRVFRTPVFAAMVSPQCRIPQLCSGCGLPAARFERLRIIRTEFAFDLEVPHCDLHRGTADLATESTKGKNAQEVAVLKVGSYRFYREFLKKNGKGIV